MIRPALAFLLAAGVGGGWAGSGPGRAEVRICAALEDAVPPGAGAVLLAFFSTGCAVCYDDLLETRAMIDREGWPVAVVGIHLGPYEELRAFLEKYRWDLPVVLDKRKALLKRFRVTVVPDKLLLAGGRVVHRDDPALDHRARREELRKCLRRSFPR